MPVMGPHRECGKAAFQYMSQVDHVIECQSIMHDVIKPLSDARLCGYRAVCCYFSNGSHMPLTYALKLISSIWIPDLSLGRRKRWCSLAVLIVDSLGCACFSRLILYAGHFALGLLCQSASRGLGACVIWCRVMSAWKLQPYLMRQSWVFLRSTTIIWYFCYHQSQTGVRQASIYKNSFLFHQYMCPRVSA